MTQGLAVCILGTGSQRRTLSLEGLLGKYVFDFQTKFLDVKITVRCGGCKAPVGPGFSTATLVREMRSLRTKILIRICQMNSSLPSSVVDP